MHHLIKKVDNILESGIGRIRSAYQTLRLTVAPAGSARERLYLRWRAFIFEKSPHEMKSILMYYSTSSYRDYQRRFEPTPDEHVVQRKEAQQWTNRPLLSIVTAVYAPLPQVIIETTESVQAQTYDNWTWTVVDASPEDTVWTYLREKASGDNRIELTRLSSNQGIASNFNTALRQTKGDFVVMLDHDDTLAPHALFSVCSAIREHPDVDFIYSDADKLNESGKRCEPLFKPQWSPETMLSYNMLNQLSVFRRSLLDRVGFFDPSTDGAQDWDLYLRISEHTQNIIHIPQVLYHWRKTQESTAKSPENKPYIRDAQRKALAAHLRRTGIQDPVVRFDDEHQINSVHPIVTWTPRQDRSISIIIPSQDHVQYLEECLVSIFQQSHYPDYEVIVVDTGSIQPETWKLYSHYESYSRFQVVDFDDEFNFSQACNLGAQQADGELLLFLNNDVIVQQVDWLQRMAQWFDRNSVGIVGPKLLYPDNSIQHAGVVLGFGGLAGHFCINAPENIGTIFGSDGWYRNVSAITAACMLISREAFDNAGGFDEDFRLNYSDVDLCLRVIDAGYRIVYTPDVRLIHHEGVTHQKRIPRSDFELASKKWQLWLRKGDPFFNPNLTVHNAYPTLRTSEEDTPYEAHIALMERLPEKEFIQLPDDIF